ncbi:MAG: hypothetical protein ABSF10_11585 [Verrucomicrobiota bacterium]|jgi:hypothetical protein
MKKNLLIILGVIGAAGLASVQAQLINVQFLDDSVNRNGNATTDEGSPIPLPVMTGAAEVGSPGDYWNGVTSSNLAYTGFPNGGHTTNAIPLLLSDGVTSSGVSMTLSSPGGTYNANATAWGNHSTFSYVSLAAALAGVNPAPWPTPLTPYSALMQTCYVCQQNGSATVTLTGLTVGQGYDVYVYTATDQNVAGGRQGQFTVNGNAQKYVWNGVTSNLVSGVSYLKFKGVAPDATGTLVIQFGGSAGETDLDGFQLQVALAGPSASKIENFSADGSRFFNAAGNFTFTIQSVSTGGAQLPTNPTNGVQVLVNGQNESSTLQFSGSNTYWNVTLPGLTSNTVYSIGMTVTNSAALVSSNSVTFDTYAPAIVVPVETYDFNGGQFIQNFIPTNAPGATSYWGVTGVIDVDYSMVAGSGVAGGGTNLAPNYPDRFGDSNVAFQVAIDMNLPLYQAQSNAAIYNVNLSYNTAGNWFNYTRNPWPSGYYRAYARVSGVNAAAGTEYLNLVTSGYGTTTQTTNNLGQFTLAAGASWNSYLWAPLTDSQGNQISVNIPSGQQTLQLLSGGGLSVIDFMLVSIPAGGLPPVINNFNPPIATAPTGNAFIPVPTSVSFSVSSLIGTVATNNIHVLVNGAPVSETFTGNNTNWTVSFPINMATNQPSVTFAVSAVDNNGLSNGVSGTFDTFSQNNFMIEAEDFDFNGGQFITNPIPTGAYVNGAYPIYAVAAWNSYFYYPEANSDNEAIVGVDLTTLTTDANETFLYRPAESAGTQVATDFLRQKFYFTNGLGVITNFNDFNLGFWDSGQWVNYTRIFPTNTYNVYGRLASAGAYSGLSLSLVTSGVGTTNQGTNLLGTFSDPNANGWQAWDWVPLLATNGQMAVVSLGGANTLQANNTTAEIVSVNANFYMLVPVAVAPQAVHLSVSRTGSTISIQFPTQSGFSYTVLYSGSLNPANWQTLTTISGDGTVKTATDTMGSSPRFYRVSFQ